VGFAHEQGTLRGVRCRVGDQAGHHAVATPASAITVVELCAAYWDFAQGYYRRNDKPTRTIQGVRATIRILNNLYGQSPVTDFGPMRLLAIQTKLAGDGLSRNYVNKLTSYIKRVFKWGVSRQLVSPHVYTALSTVVGLRMGRSPAREAKPVLPVADEVVNATLPHLPVVVADMVRFQRATGARPGEVCQLRPCDLDRNGDVWEYRPQSHKTAYRGRERTIYIGPKAQAVLLPYLLRAPDAHCFSPKDSVKKRQIVIRARRKTRVQPSQQNRCKRRPKRLPGEAYGRQSYCQAVSRAIQRANKERTEAAADMGIESMLLPDWTPNQLRHSKAIQVRREFGLEAAQVILGHAKADVTQVYAERDAALAVEVARKIG
jgi:integrase